MRTITYTAFTLVFLVVLAGSIVRMTGSGMGCPDWPKCFGLLIPPISEAQITWKQGAEYTEGQMVIANDTLWQTTKGHIAVGSDLKDCECWEKYEKHNYAHFNASHTWTEYINRLLGALSGIPIILLFLMTLMENKKKGIFISSGALFFVLLAAWIGKVVVDENLEAFMITIHVVVALMVLAFLVGMMQYVSRKKYNVSKNIRILILASLVISFLQLVLGTQVREKIDVLLEHGVERENLISELPSWWKIHRSAIWPLMLLHLSWTVSIFKVKELRIYTRGILAIISTLAITGFVFVKLGMPALIQPLHILLAFSLVLLNLRTYLATRKGERKPPT